jgi:hypothetical protein
MKKIIILGIVFLFVGICFQPAYANNNNIIETPANYQLKDTIDLSKELLSRGKIAYSWRQYIDGPCYFQLDDPGDVTQLADYSTQPWFYSGGTWTNDGRWLCCEHGSGSLCEINPVNGDLHHFGGGGNIINGLACNPVDNKLYGAGSFNLYEVNNITGDHTFIGEFGEGPEYMIGIAFDRYGILYGWDVGNDNLWTIDIETGQATLVGPLGIDLMYAQDGHFDIAEDILYLAASTVNPYFCGLYKCDEDTGDCTLVGQFENNYPHSALAIPYNLSNIPPYVPSNYSIDELSENVVNLSWDGGDPDPSDFVYYDVYFDDVYPPFNVTTVGPYPWNQTRIEHGPVELECYKTYYMMICAYDNHGAFVEGPICSFTTGDNHPPTYPIIDGPTHGKVGVEYTYTFISADPENHSIKYLVNWGDGTEDITDLLPNSTIVTLSHSWDTKGTYIIKAKAIDEHNAVSGWGNLTVTIPRDKAVTSNILLQRFLDRFPLLQRLMDIWRSFTY